MTRVGLESSEKPPKYMTGGYLGTGTTGVQNAKGGMGDFQRDRG